MKVVINSLYGGFGLSPKALLWLYERGVTEIATPVEKYFNGKSHESDLKTWHDVMDEKSDTMFFHVFTPDEKFVLYQRSIRRDHPLLIECVEALGREANGKFADLSVVEIPDGIEWEISEYDGWERVEEKHRSWS